MDTWAILRKNCNGISGIIGAVVFTATLFEHFKRNMRWVIDRDFFKICNCVKGTVLAKSGFRKETSSHNSKRTSNVQKNHILVKVGNQHIEAAYRQSFRKLKEGDTVWVFSMNGDKHQLKKIKYAIKI